MTKLKDYKPFCDAIHHYEIGEVLVDLITNSVKEKLYAQPGEIAENVIEDVKQLAEMREFERLDKYDKLISDIIEAELKKIPENFLWCMYRVFHLKGLNGKEEAEEIGITGDLLRDVFRNVCIETGISQQYSDKLKYLFLMHADNCMDFFSRKYHLSIKEILNGFETPMSDWESVFWTECEAALCQYIDRQWENVGGHFLWAVVDEDLKSWVLLKEAHKLELFKEFCSKYKLENLFCYKPANIVAKKIENSEYFSLEDFDVLVSHSNESEMSGKRKAFWNNYEAMLCGLVADEEKKIPRYFMEGAFISLHWYDFKENYSPSEQINFTEMIPQFFLETVISYLPEIKDYFYNYVLNHSLDKIKRMPGLTGRSVYVELGDQINNGCSYYWDCYVDTIERAIAAEVDDIPDKILKAIVHDEDLLEDSSCFKEDYGTGAGSAFVKQIFDEIYRLAEEEYEEEEEEYDSDDESDYDEDDSCDDDDEDYDDCDDDGEESDADESDDDAVTVPLSHAGVVSE